MPHRRPWPEPTGGRLHNSRLSSTVDLLILVEDEATEERAVR